MTPAAEVDLTPEVVRALLDEQFPDLAGLPLELTANGWDNGVFRLGDDLAVRLPRRALAAGLVASEQRWLPQLAPLIPLPIPAPVRCGAPSADVGYPWPWSVCPWLPGRVALETPPADPLAAATAIGTFVAALHVPAPADAPRNPYRGIPLAARTERLHASLAALPDDAAAVAASWEEIVATPAWPGPPVWLHGDLHPANVLVADGAVAAVIDFGDITSGDPATDFAIAWMLFDDDGPRHVLRAAAGGVDDDTWARARGWALALAVAILHGSHDHPTYVAMARRTIANVLSGRGRRVPS